MIEGRASGEGTARFRERFADRVDPGHFRRLGELWLSSVGLGTYLGDADDATDARYEEAVLAALAAGCNVFDCAINYRHQRSERAVGAALERAFAEGVASRDEVFVSTKGGFLPFDALLPDDPPDYLRRTWIEEGPLEAADLAAGCHAMTPRFLEDQLGRSRDNLGLDTIDLYYVHNPENQLADHPHDHVVAAIADAAAALAAKREAGELARWGLATWNALRVPPDAADHLSLQQIAATVARKAGEDSGFAAVQLPLSLAMPEALLAPSQPLGEVWVPAVVAARHHGLATFTSASILQGRLAQNLPAEIADALPGLATDAQRALQFTRSADGVTTALVGMANTSHVEENLALATHPPAPEEAYRRLFQPHR